MRILSYRNVEVPATTAHSLNSVRSSYQMSSRAPVDFVASRGRCQVPFAKLYQFSLEDAPQFRLRLPPTRQKALASLWRKAYALHWLRRHRQEFPLVYVSQARPLKFFARVKALRLWQFKLVLECHAESDSWGRELGAADGIVYTSGSLREVMFSRFPCLRNKPVFISGHKVRSIPECPPESELATPPGAPFVLCYVGSILPWKGLETLVAAGPRLPPGSEVLIVGGQPDDAYRESLVGRARELGVAARIRFTPFVPPAELAGLLKSVGGFVLPLPGEEQGSTPIKLFEYLSWARPVLATNLPSTRELIEHGRNGLLFAPGSAGSLAEQAGVLLRMSASERRALVGAGLESLRPFLFENWLNGIFAWFETLLAAVPGT